MDKFRMEFETIQSTTDFFFENWKKRKKKDARTDKVSHAQRQFYMHLCMYNLKKNRHLNRALHELELQILLIILKIENSVY